MYCHSTCEEYKAFRKAKDEENAQIKKIKDAEKSFSEYIANNALKRIRRYGKRWIEKKR